MNKLKQPLPYEVEYSILQTSRAVQIGFLVCAITSVITVFFIPAAGSKSLWVFLTVGFSIFSLLATRVVHIQTKIINHHYPTRKPGDTKTKS